MGGPSDAGAGLVVDRSVRPSGSVSVWKVLRALIAVAAILVLVRGALSARAPTETARSRLATVVALAHYGTWHIDRPEGGPPISFEERTIDKVKVGDRLISSKPPMLSLAMTAEYLLIKAFFGWRLDNEEEAGRISESEKAQAVIDLIVEIVEPDAWDINGGEYATIRFYQGVLIIRAPDYIHRQIGGYPFNIRPTRQSIASSGLSRRSLTFSGDTASVEITPSRGVKSPGLDVVADSKP